MERRESYQDALDKVLDTRHKVEVGDFTKKNAKEVALNYIRTHIDLYSNNNTADSDKIDPEDFRKKELEKFQSALGILEREGDWLQIREVIMRDGDFLFEVWGESANKTRNNFCKLANYLK